MTIRPLQKPMRRMVPVSSGIRTTFENVPSVPPGVRAICFHPWYSRRMPGGT